ncbi:MAG TPA: hypothetical protein VNE17_04170 [Nitrolancea sp.]|nr:hypothetical protein [Nitrolancea sp.]
MTVHANMTPGGQPPWLASLPFALPLANSLTDFFNFGGTIDIANVRAILLAA